MVEENQTEFNLLSNNVRIQKKKANSDGRPKFLVWETHVIKGKKVSKGHYEVTCLYCNTFWHKGLLQDLKRHFANNCLKVLIEIKQFFLNWLAAKTEVLINSQQISNKKWKFDNESADQSWITDFHESSKFSQERIHEINQVCVKAFTIYGIP